jgi:hypothetical protein
VTHLERDTVELERNTARTLAGERRISFGARENAEGSEEGNTDRERLSPTGGYGGGACLPKSRMWINASIAGSNDASPVANGTKVAEHHPSGWASKDDRGSKDDEQESPVVRTSNAPDTAHVTVATSVTIDRTRTEESLFLSCLLQSRRHRQAEQVRILLPRMHHSVKRCNPHLSVVGNVDVSRMNKNRQTSGIVARRRGEDPQNPSNRWD